MATPVVVYCGHILGGVFRDLHGGNPVVGGVRRMQSTLRRHGEVRGEKVTYYLDCDTPLVPGGSVHLEASGDSFPGLVEAEISAVRAMVELVRTEHRIFPADYSFIRITERRMLFNAMRSRINSVSRSYARMELSANEGQTAMVQVCEVLSKFMGRLQSIVSNSEVAAISGAEVIIKHKAAQFDLALRQAASLVDLAMRRDVEPEVQRRFDRTVPNDQKVDWDRSFETLRVVYEEAVKKLPGPVTNIMVYELTDGSFQGSVLLAGHPNEITGGLAPTQPAAEAKLCYEVIKHVEQNLETPILDLNHDVLKHQEGCIDRFDRRMRCLFSCAEKLKVQLDAAQEIMVSVSHELGPQIPNNPYCEGIFVSLVAYTLKVNIARDNFYEEWLQMQNLKVDRATLESTVRNAS